MSGDGDEIGDRWRLNTIERPPARVRSPGKRPRLVIVESPYAGDVAENIKYARACMADCFRRGEAPMLSHLLYTQVLDDSDPEERRLGIEAGLAWGAVAELTAVYTDRGISEGMWHGIGRAREDGREVEMRRIPELLRWWR